MGQLLAVKGDKKSVPPFDKLRIRDR